MNNARMAWIAALLLGAPVITAQDSIPTRPNILLVLLDDAGWTDFSCMGGPHHTPRIDALAREGRRFTHFRVAQAVCSASRAAILTGCYPNRIGLLHALMPEATHGIAESETTLAEALRAVGYRTAIFGKWHLGSKEAFLPTRHGFDTWYGIPYSNDMWSGRRLTEPTAREFPPLPIYLNTEKVGVVDSMAGQARLTTDLASRACEFIRATKGKPFLCYVPFTQPHMPIAATDAYKNRSKSGPYGDVMLELDANIGKMVDTIDEMGLREQTMVIVTSDNGPWLVYGDHAGTSLGLREGKGTMWEGGCRVPLIVRWPTRVAAGSVCDELLASIDLFPTLLSLSSATGGALKIDGQERVSTLLGGAKPKASRDPMIDWYGTELIGVRDGRFKLVFTHDYMALLQPGVGAARGTMQKRRAAKALYDLSVDPGESTDVSTAHPDVVAKLDAVAEAAREDLGDTLTGRTGKNVRACGQLNPESRPRDGR